MKKLTQEEFLDKMKEKFPGYSFPDPYVNSITKMKVICPKKHEYYLTPNNLMHTLIKDVQSVIIHMLEKEKMIFTQNTLI